MGRRMFFLYSLASMLSIGTGVFKRLLPGQEGEEKEETTFIFKIFGQTVIIDWAEIIVGDPAGSNVRISGDGVQIRFAETVKGSWQADGDIFIGSNISSPATTYFSVFANAQTYNSESVGAGDVLFGNNSAGKGNVFYDVSANQWRFRTGGDAVVVVNSSNDTFSAPGLITTGTAVEINSVPLKFNEMDDTPSGPSGNVESILYMKNDKLIAAFDDSGTVRYKYLDLTGTGVTWVHTTTAP